MSSVAEIVKENVCKAARLDSERRREFDPERNLFTGYGLTSLDMVLVLTAACEQAGVPLSAFTDGDLAELTTPRRIAEALQARGPAPAQRP